jgi:hypothetical protein
MAQNSKYVRLGHYETYCCYANSSTGTWGAEQEEVTANT